MSAWNWALMVVQFYERIFFCDLVWLRRCYQLYLSTCHFDWCSHNLSVSICTSISLVYHSFELLRPLLVLKHGSRSSIFTRNWSLDKSYCLSNSVCTASHSNVVCSLAICQVVINVLLVWCISVFTSRASISRLLPLNRLRTTGRIIACFEGLGSWTIFLHWCGGYVRVRLRFSRIVSRTTGWSLYCLCILGIWRRTNKIHIAALLPIHRAPILV